MNPDNLNDDDKLYDQGGFELLNDDDDAPDEDIASDISTFFFFNLESKFSDG